MKYYDTTSIKPSRLDKVPPLEQRRTDSTQVRLMALGAVMAMALLSGCASPGLQSDSEQLKYNSDTGYPAVGGSDWVSL